ncbi:protein TolB [Fibrobacterales bacterium]|nr:protein TolB [Fibrobacterales bacterium]
MLFLATLLFLFGTALYAQQDTITMDIAVSTEKTLPIGIVDFSLDKSRWGKLDEMPEKTVARDLELSGRFSTTALASYNLLSLSRAGAKHFVTGTLSLEGGQAKLECKLYATTTKEVVKGFVYTSTPEQVRTSIHKCVDNIVFQLWGVQGFASTQIAWVQKIDGKKQIVVADYDGFRKRQITKHNSINTMPSWSNDNSKIYFTSFRNGPPQLFERHLSLDQDKRIFPQIAQAFGASQNPTNGSLIFSVAPAQGGTDIWVGDPQTGKANRLIFTKSIEVSPSWSPKGTAFLFSSDKGGAPQIYMSLKDGSDVQRVSFIGKYNESAVWSPDGDRIAYCSMDNGKLNIYTSTIDGSDVRKLTFEGNNEHPVWSPDGMSIAFSSDRSGSSQIYIMRRDGSGVTRITSIGENTTPAWSHYNKPPSQSKTAPSQNINSPLALQYFNNPQKGVAR